MLMGALLASCAGSSGGGFIDPGAGDGGDGGGGDWPAWDDGGGSINPLADGTDVALVESLASPMEWFNLRVTMPVPRGTFPRSDGKIPFAIRNWDDQVLAAQVETVTRYPEAGAGADVVEITGRVSRPPGFTAGMPLYYGIVASPHDPLPVVEGNERVKLQWGPIQVPEAVRLLIADTDSIQIRTHDCFGHEYLHRPLATQHKKLTKYGQTTAQMRTHGSLQPTTWVDGSNGTLSHMMGVHTYISTFRQEAMIGFDMRIHNAHSGFDQGDAMDDPSGTVYFEEVEVMVPLGWSVLQDVVDPMFGDSYVEGGYRVFPVVKPAGGNKLHVMNWQQQFHRRLMITLDNNVDRAGVMLNAGGIGFVKDVTDPTEGHEGYSWWNPGTARYFSVNHQLPLLNHVGQGNVRNELYGDYNSLANHVRAGTGTGQYPVFSERLGWAHPYGVGYGGMTGGDEVIMFDGVRTAWSASQSGIQLALLRHRMHSDRQADAMFDRNGDPTHVNQWIIHGSGLPYAPFLIYMLPFLNHGDPFGVGDAPMFQVNHVRGANRQPDYEQTLSGFAPHDQQHMVRYTHTPKVLVWLANDTLAKDDLTMQAEVWHLSYHEFNKNQWGDTQVNGLLAHRDHIAEFPGSGFTFSRGEGWGLDVASSVYAFASDEWRSRNAPWFNQIADNLNNGIGSCNGFIQANVNEKFVNGLYRARQQIEHSIIENGIRGMLETVYKGRDAGYTALLENVLTQSTEAFIGPMAWYPGEFAPWTYTAVAPIPGEEGIWCDASQIPANGYAPSYENYQNWSSFAYGYEVSGNSAFLDKAQIQAGGGDLLPSLLNAGTNNLGNRAALIAMMQRLNGEI